jgi:hypothetical protein
MMDEFGYHGMIERSIRIAKELEMDKVVEAVKKADYGREDLALFTQLRKEDSRKVNLALKSLCNNDYYGKKAYSASVNKFVSFLEEVMIIRWFRPCSRYSECDLDDDVDGMCKGLNIYKLETKIERDLPSAIKTNLSTDWGSWESSDKYRTRLAISKAIGKLDSFNSPWTLAVNIAQSVVKSGVTIRDLLSGEIREEDFIACGGDRNNPAYGAIMDVVDCSKHILAEGIPGFKEKHPVNPFDNLVWIYEKGLWPAGPRDGEFVIWHPDVKAVR